MPRVVITAASFCRNQVLCGEASQAFAGHELVFKPLDSRVSAADVAEALNGFDAAIVGREKISREVLACPHPPRVIVKYGVGMDNVDPSVSPAIRVIETPGSNAFAVAEHTLGLALALAHNIARGDRLLREGKWWKNGGRSLAGKTVVVVGVGHVGSRVARLFRALECLVTGVDLRDKSDFLRSIGARQEELLPALESADIVTLHVPLTSLTSRMVDRHFLARIRQGSFLLNTSRGEVVVEADLLEALDSGRLAGAGLDVFELEPPENKELINHPAVLCTPHIAGNSLEAVLAMGRASIAGLQNALKDNRRF